MDTSTNRRLVLLQKAIQYAPLTITPETPLPIVLERMHGGEQECELCQSPHSAAPHPQRITAAAFRDTSRDTSSFALVAQDGQLQGILTERDIVRLSASGQSLLGKTACQVMTSQVITLNIHQLNDIFVPLQMFQKYHIRHLPVIDDRGSIVGVVTAESVRQILQPADLLRLRRVSDVMTTQVITASPIASILQVAQLMATHQVSCVVIAIPLQSQHRSQAVSWLDVQGCPKPNPIELGTKFRDLDASKTVLLHPVGIITERDIVRFQALEMNLEQVRAEVVMSAPPVCCQAPDSLWDVHQIMQQRGLRRIVVWGDRQELLGIVTQSSLLRVLDPMELYNVLDVLQQRVSELEAERNALQAHRTTQLEAEVQRRTQELQQQAEREQLLAAIAQRVRQSLNLDEVLSIAVGEVQQLLQADRVLVCQFASDPMHPDDHDIVVAESVARTWPSYLGQQISDLCFHEEERIVLQQGTAIAINHVKQAEFSAPHLRSLQQGEVQAKLVVPIIIADELWGGLVVHQCSAPRQWQCSEIELLERLSVQLAIAIQQARAYQQLQRELAERKQVEQQIYRLNEHLEQRVQERTAELQEANQKLQQEVAERQKFVALIDHSIDMIAMSTVDHQMTYLNQAGRELLGVDEETDITALTIQDFHFPEDWPALASRIIKPLTRGYPWQGEVRLRHFQTGAAIPMQHSAFPIKHAITGEVIAFAGILRDLTERKQVEQVLREGRERERLLGAIAQRIRESLELGEILSATVEAVQQLLAADRVLVYRLLPNGSGSVIAEALATDQPALQGITLPSDIFPAECYLPYVQGRTYALADRDQGNVIPCLVEFMKRMNIRAKLVVPLILPGKRYQQSPKQLWGLLIAHQCNQPRHWQDWEIDLLQQLSNQLAIAIQQSALYAKLQVELQEREKSLQERKRVEAQLKASLEEKELLLKEVHHRVKNNLQVISSIFSLQTGYINDPRILSTLEESQDRIRSMALIHEKLYQSDRLARIDFADYIQTLVNNLFTSYNVSPMMINLRLQVSDIHLSLDAAIPCGLLINELVSNSLKHAFPTPSALPSPQGELGEIVIQFTAIDDHFDLTVRDNGIGLPSNLDLPHLESLGLALVRALTFQLKGKLEMYTDHGAVFHISFPKPREHRRIA